MAGAGYTAGAGDGHGAGTGVGVLLGDMHGVGLTI